MALKSKILLLLEEKKGSAVSGQEIAEALSVSRSAVWKAINALKEEGHQIEAVPNKGYTLKKMSDVLSFEGIYPHLNDEFKDIDLKVMGEVTSTNLLARESTLENGRPLVIIANSQTKGRGRKGRDFFSPPDTGIYMSFLLEPAKRFEETIRTTIAAAVAVKNALSKFTTKNVQIKWVNDIFADNKKVCGILTEAVTDLETREISKVVVGIGINVTTESFPEDILNVAGSVSEKPVSRNLIASEVINSFLTLYKDLTDEYIINEYKKASLVMGRTITYSRNGVSYTGVVRDINDNGNLIVERDGTEDVLSSGEVSLGSSSFAK